MRSADGADSSQCHEVDGHQPASSMVWEGREGMSHSTLEAEVDGRRRTIHDEAVLRSARLSRLD